MCRHIPIPRIKDGAESADSIFVDSAAFIQQANRNHADNSEVQTTAISIP